MDDPEMYKVRTNVCVLCVCVCGLGLTEAIQKLNSLGAHSRICIPRRSVTQQYKILHSFIPSITLVIILYSKLKRKINQNINQSIQASRR